jgi:hypothetical protein
MNDAPSRIDFRTVLDTIPLGWWITIRTADDQGNDIEIVGEVTHKAGRYATSIVTPNKEGFIMISPIDGSAPLRYLDTDLARVDFTVMESRP